jgi:multiple antibiotic resistance protein
MKNFELSWGDIFIVFFLTLGPLKAILPFARATQGTDLAFRRKMAWQATAIATVIALVVALLAPLVLTNWHVSPPAVSITAGIILFAQALRIVMQAPPAPGSATPPANPSPPFPAIAVFPLAMPAILTAPGIAAIAVVISLNKHDPASAAIVIVILLGVMVLNLLTLWNNEAILKRGLAGILPVIGWVLAVLQAALAVQIIIHALRVLEVMHWPAS